MNSIGHKRLTPTEKANGQAPSELGLALPSDIIRHELPVELPTWTRCRSGLRRRAKKCDILHDRSITATASLHPNIHHTRHTWLPRLFVLHSNSFFKVPSTGNFVQTPNDASQFASKQTAYPNVGNSAAVCCFFCSFDLFWTSHS